MSSLCDLLDVGLGPQLRHNMATGDGCELVSLETEGQIDRINITTVERHFDVLHALLTKFGRFCPRSTEFRYPPASTLPMHHHQFEATDCAMTRSAFEALDAKHSLKISNSRSKGQRLAFYKHEAEKLPKLMMILINKL